MGYFSNGTEGMLYEEEWCVNCEHYNDGMCPVLGAHAIYNYQECNNKESILHMLIPRAGSRNEKCKMYINISIYQYRGVKEGMMIKLHKYLLVLNRGGILSDVEVDYYNRGAEAQNAETLRLATPEIEAKARKEIIKVVDDLLDSMELGIDDFPLSAWNRWQALKEKDDR